MLCDVLISITGLALLSGAGRVASGGLRWLRPPMWVCKGLPAPQEDLCF